MGGFAILSESQGDRKNSAMLKASFAQPLRRLLRIRSVQFSQTFFCSDSKGRGAIWRMIGNQVLFTQMPATLQDQDPLFNGFIGPVTGYSDGWDAYPETRYQVSL
jgi:hypothetical protein